MLAGSYLTRIKVGSGNRIKYILGYIRKTQHHLRTT